MKTPSLLMAAAIGFWGWQSSQVVISILLALAVESPRIVASRYTFSQKDLNRISDLCALICLIMAVYFFVAHKSVRAIFMTVQWLPIAFAPLILTQVYNTADRINVGGFFMVIRRKYPDGRPSGPFINFSFPYLALCILGASTANISNRTFYIGLILIAACALWSMRPARFSPALWSGAALFAVVAGYTGQIGLHNLQLLLEQKGVEWFVNSAREDRDPFQNITAMGDVGILKQSNRILFRVKRSREIELPLLLRGASFNIYRNSVWFSRKAPFNLTLKPERDGRTWMLAPGMECGGGIEVTAYLKNGKGILPLPAGTVKLHDLPAVAVHRNRFGVASIEGGPGFVSYGVCFDLDRSTDSPPDRDDIQVPETELKAIRAVIARWRLAGRPPEEAARVIRERFAAEFTYSVVLKGNNTGKTPVANFLAQTKSGHCEYFGTATVLIFRALGIPARYMSGYAVHEQDPWGKDLVVRSRHAHAWAQAYLGGKWVNVDTTPASWPEFESERAGLWQPVGDLWTWCRFQFSKWLYNDVNGAGGKRKYLIWLVVMVLVVCVGLFSRKKRVKQGEVVKNDNKSKEIMPGADSPFYLVEARIKSWGFSRGSPEPLTTFLERVRRAGPEGEKEIESLERLLLHHYRYRFDPLGVRSEEKVAFEREVRNWLEAAGDRQSR
jgi:transglutaminase-like putative cysteine protease